MINRPMKIFLDVGSHKGETVGIALETKYGFDKLFCFEPVTECCEIISTTYKDKRVEICKFGLWDKDCVLPLYGAGDRGASVFKEKPNRHKDVSRNVRFVQASKWFNENLNDNDKIYLKLNCEGSECVILEDLIVSGQSKKIDVLIVDFDVRKIPSQKHLMPQMKAKLAKLSIPKIFYTDEYNLGNKSHNYFTHFWLDKS